MRFSELDDYTKEYVLTGLWEDVENLGDPLSLESRTRQVADETLAEAVRECQEFRRRAQHLVLDSEWVRAGMDFWLSRNQRKQLGFNDGSWGGSGPELDRIARSFGPKHYGLDGEGQVVVVAGA